MSNAHENFTMAAPAVQASFNGRVPKTAYTVRVTGLKTMLEDVVKPKGSYKRTTFSCEILGPDPVTDKDGQQYSVAGRKFNIGLPISPESSQYGDVYTALASWGYKKDDGTIDIQKFWDDCRSQSLFFQVMLDSEESTVRDGAGQPIPGPDGKPITKGWQIKWVNPSDLLFRVNPESPTAAAPY